MIEEPIKDAIGTVAGSGLLGALLFLSWVLFGLTTRWLISQIKEAKGETKTVMADYKHSIETQMADIRSLANVTASVDSLKPMIEMLIRNQRGS